MESEMLHNFRYYEQEPVSVRPEAHVFEIAEAMDEHSVGSVLVVDAGGQPLGIVTDRDLVRRVVAAGRDAEKTRARDVMTSELVTGSRGELLPSVVEKLRAHGIRRLPLLEAGQVTSVVSLDDVVFHLLGALFNLAETTRLEVIEAARGARRRRRQEAREEAFEEVQAHLATLGHDVAAKLREELARVLGRTRGG
jgi:signal-transduction protein with cAMP-binding, CBS, and nucleotidyltransferase domain